MPDVKLKVLKDDDGKATTHTSCMKNTGKRQMKTDSMENVINENDK